MEFLGKKIEFGTNTLKKSLADFKAEMAFLVECYPADQRDEILEGLYKEATGRDTVEVKSSKSKKAKDDTE